MPRPRRRIPRWHRGCELTYLTLKKTVSESFCRADLPQGRTASCASRRSVLHRHGKMCAAARSARVKERSRPFSPVRDLDVEPFNLRVHALKNFRDNLVAVPFELKTHR